MRNIPFVSFALAILAVPLASAQSLVESATAAAGGSAAGMAGKTVSEGIDSVFSKVAGAAGSSASQGRKSGRIAPAVPPIPSVRLDAHQGAELSGAKKSSAATPQAGRQARLQAGAVTETPVSATAHTPQAAAAPAPSGPTLRDLQSLSAGASREQVFNKLGQPASRISMSNDDGFVEIMKFRNQDGSIGSVRVVNGKVAAVNAAQ
ncbi:MAG: hypothetical protein IT166_22560 [Bryobacterales bacterium]|nr:hypothetical protein [Bryobacterales bacterium]